LEDITEHMLVDVKVMVSLEWAHYSNTGQYEVNTVA
jgi:hypothetical protein